MATTATLCTNDFLGRELVNPIPGAPGATDYLGRLIIGNEPASDDTDYLGRDLILVAS